MTIKPPATPGVLVIVPVFVYIVSTTPKTIKRLLHYIALATLITGCGSAGTPPAQKDTLSKTTSHGCAPSITDKAWYASGIKAPLFKGLEGIDMKITTGSQEARRYFNQGMMLSYGFNHAEAARSFFEATRLDTACAMAFWGYAYVLGPNYNAGMEDDNYQRAYTAVQKARSLSAKCTKKEQDLIQALAARYAETPPADRKPLDIAFSGAMKKVYKKYPSDPDVSAIYAESMMDLHPWDLYDKKTREPRPWTKEIVAVLERLKKLHPHHPGAPHFYIHAVEASKDPGRGLASARLLTTLVPGSGHLVHMPSHIYIRTGDYHLGSLVNIAAISIDSSYITACHAQGAYPLAYYPHNYHFLAATATLEGNSKLAWMAAKKVQENTAQDIMKLPGWGTLQHYYTIPCYVAVKLEMWDSILAMKPPEEALVYPNAIWRYARGMAYLGKDSIPEAERELSQLIHLSKDTVLKRMTIWDINNMNDIVQIAVNVLSAAVYNKKKDPDQAIDLLTRAIEIEDQLNYNEPPDWFFSVRHYLGSVLLATGKYGDAENVYLQDLNNYPRNGWALMGLYQALQKQGKDKQARDVKKQLDKAWAYADISIPLPG